MTALAPLPTLQACAHGPREKCQLLAIVLKICLRRKAGPLRRGYAVGPLDLISRQFPRRGERHENRLVGIIVDGEHRQVSEFVPHEIAAEDLQYP